MCAYWGLQQHDRSNCSVQRLLHFRIPRSFSFAPLARFSLRCVICARLAAARLLCARCINYANEKLQQQFNAFVFKLEQAEYAAEQILWSFVDFPDNRECLELLEQKHVGVLAVLDEQCVLISRATDKGLASHLYDKCGTHKSFRASAAEKRSGLFVVAHYAGEVG